MQIVDWQPYTLAANATPCAWLPADAAITPFSRSSGVKEATLLYAPLSLKEPVRCKFSNFSHTSQPATSLTDVA